MELKKYVLFTDGMVYKHNHISDLYHYMSDDSKCIYVDNINQDEVLKTSDNILDFVEVGDLVKVFGIPQPLYFDGMVNVDRMKKNKNIEFIYKLQPNGDYKRYEVKA